MPRNINGTYVLPAGNPVVPGTLIESTWANPTMSDLGNEITQSLPRNGSAPMTGPLILSRDALLNMEAVTKQQFEASLNATNSYMPAGVIQAFAFSTVPTGWLECNGAAVSRTTYANLFATIGTTYGAGNGVTTFNLPDLRGEFIRGFDNGRSVDPARAFGSNQAPANNPHNHTLTDPTHTHSQAAHTHGVTDPGHSHAGVWLQANTAGDNIKTEAGVDVAPTAIPNSTTGISIQSSNPSIGSAGTGVSIAPEGVEARPRNVAMMYCIKAFGALQTDGLGTMAFQNKETVNILGGSGVFTTLSCTSAPVNPNDVARLADVGGSIAEIFSSDVSVLLVDNTDPSNPILRPQTNVPNGMVKLDALGKVPNALLDPTGYNYQGTWDASPGLLPGGLQLDGSLYYISIAGTLTLYHEDGVAVPTLCSVGDRIVYVTDSPTLPVPGWYYEPSASIVATALTTSFAPSGTIVATNVQAAIEELDGDIVSLSADLAADSGSSLVGFAPMGTGVAADLESYLRDADPVLFVSYMTPADRVANDLAPGSVDLNYAFVAMLADMPGGGKIKMPAGRFKSNSAIPLHSGLSWYGETCVNDVFGVPTYAERPTYIFTDVDAGILFDHAAGVQMESVQFFDISFGARLNPTVTPRGTATGFNFSGSYPNDIKHMTFERCQFSNFGGYGIRVRDPLAPHGDPDWNVCPVVMNDCTFYFNSIGIELDADNADFWQINGTAFFQGVGAYGINCKRSGMLTLNQCFGGGGTMVITSGTIRDSLILNSCQFEAGTAMLQVADTMATQQTYRPIVLNGCIVESPIILSSPCHFSSINTRYVDNIEVTVAGIVIESRGDSFLPSTAVNLVAGSEVRTFLNHGTDLPIGVRGQIIDGKCVLTAAAPPVGGSVGFKVGDITYNSAPAIGAPIGWVCTVAGAPGTWQIIGYVQGAGATVTQLTNKGTNVTNNVLNGQVITNNSALGAGVLTAFQVADSFVTAKDSISCCLSAGANDPSYTLQVAAFNGGFVVYLKNISAGSLSEALVINFAVHKSTF